MKYQEQIPSVKTCDVTGWLIMFHEIGHAVDNANVYSLRHKVIFDIKYEFDELIESHLKIIGHSLFPSSG